MPENIEFNKLCNSIKYLSEAEQTQIKKAYQLASVAHYGVLRDEGVPYIVHPIAVANMLANLKMDSEMIATGLLHDVVEDTSVTLNQIEKEFSGKIANLVDGVTKLKKIKIKHSSPLASNSFNSDERFSFEKHTESLRKMFLATAYDIRVIIIKLADRLHNMQTIAKTRPDKRVRIAQETLEIYAPIAYRLGMGSFKGQLEDLAFPYAHPQEYLEVVNLAGDEVKNKEIYIKNFLSVLRKLLGQNRVSVIDIHGRAKHLYSLWRKLNKYDFDLTKIYDLMAVRIIVPDIASCYQTLGIIHGEWTPLIGRIKDYISLPKPNGYQSLHTTIFGPDGKIVEIQIRTIEMHQNAEQGIAAHWHYKEKSKNHKLDPQATKFINEISQIGLNIKNLNEFQASLNLDLLNDRIFVFTPKGDVVDLPIGATPVDLAYAIHSDLGHSTQGAKADNKIIPLDRELTNGEIVEIITSKSTKPKRDWLKFVKTARARNCIKNKLGLN